MTKRMIYMLIGVGILFGLIFGYTAFKSYMMKKYMTAGGVPPVTVTTIEAKNLSWQPKLKASGSLRAIKGVNVTTEIAGLVRTIQFTAGTDVKEGELLVKLNDDPEVAQLNALKAAADIAKITYDRDKAQYEVQAISKQTLDNDEATLRGAVAQVNQQKAVVAKKIILAPFSGRLGISYVNPGQYLNPGDKIVTLQTLDPIYVDFYLPQQALKQISKGQNVILTSDSFSGQTFTGKISTISPLIDVATRNIQVEAIVNNPKHQLLPGMFASVEIETGKPISYLTLPQTAISYNPYGEIAYIVKEKTETENDDKDKKKVKDKKKNKDKDNTSTLIAHQTFVTVGDSRGDQVAVLKGINEGDIVVTSGQLKLKNGSTVIINNTVVPSNNPSPQIVDE